ncbi:hypothetical protein AJ79_10210, partial [Helicocarpus griseus UAMH5409]
MKSTKVPATHRRQCTEKNQKWHILQQAFKDGPFPIVSCEKVWASSENLIDWSLPPGERQYKILKGTQARKTQSTFADRLNLIYVTHKVDMKALKVCSCERGVGRKTCAFKMVAEEFHCDIDEVIRLDNRGRGYIKLMEGGGPAVILELAESVSSMCENSLPETQRQLFTTWLNTQYPEKERISKCNEAAKIIYEGLRITQGPELKDSHSRLLDILRKHEWEPEDSTQPSEPSSTVAIWHTDKPQQDMSQLNTDVERQLDEADRLSISPGSSQPEQTFITSEPLPGTSIVNAEYPRSARPRGEGYNTLGETPRAANYVNVDSNGRNDDHEGGVALDWTKRRRIDVEGQNQPPASTGRARISASYAPSTWETPTLYDAADGSARMNESQQSDTQWDFPAQHSISTTDDRSNEQTSEESRQSPSTAMDPAQDGNSAETAMEGQDTQNPPASHIQQTDTQSQLNTPEQERRGPFSPSGSVSNTVDRLSHIRNKDAWAMQSGGVGPLSPDEYIPDTDAWAMQSGGVGTLSPDEYIPDTDAWAMQSGGVGPLSPDEYIPDTDAWAMQSGG